METNSMYSSHPRKEEEPAPNPPPEPIHESICDSLDHYADKPLPAMANSSLYGFGARLMKDFMGEV